MHRCAIISITPRSPLVKYNYRGALIMKCKECHSNKFFVDTLGIEHCSECYAPTGEITEATGKLSYKQIELEKELRKRRATKID